MLIYTNKGTGYFQKISECYLQVFYYDVDDWVGRWMDEWGKPLFGAGKSLIGMKSDTVMRWSTLKAVDETAFHYNPSVSWQAMGIIPGQGRTEPIGIRSIMPWGWPLLGAHSHYSTEIKKDSICCKNSICPGAWEGLSPSLYLGPIDWQPRGLLLS